MNELQIIQSKIFELRGQRVMLDFDLAALYGVETRVLNQAVKRNIERFPEDFMFQLTKGELEILRAKLSGNWISQSVISKSSTRKDYEDMTSQIVMSNDIGNEDDTNWISQNATSNFAKMGLRKLPFAFTENGVAMLSSVLRSPLAIQINIGIMRVFTEFRRMAATLPLPDSNAELRAEIQAVRDEMNEILADQNDINESTRAQLDAISTALAELQSKEPFRQKRRPIGFIQPKEDDNDKEK